jgi:putative SOS response-associated peptidase YedK
MEEDRAGTTTEVSKGKVVLGMAGIWGPWQNPKTDQWEDTFAIITTDPNKKMAEIHSRQPVILKPSEYAEWLEESDRPSLHLLRIFPDEDLEVDPIDPPAKAEPTKPDEPPAQSGLLFG